MTMRKKKEHYKKRQVPTGNKKKPCEHCGKETKHRVDHFSLTGEYSTKRAHVICRACWESIEFSREIRHQNMDTDAWGNYEDSEEYYKPSDSD